MRIQTIFVNGFEFALFEWYFGNDNQFESFVFIIRLSLLVVEYFLLLGSPELVSLKAWTGLGMVKLILVITIVPQ